MVRLLLAVIVSVQILRCAAAVLDSNKICSYYNREEPTDGLYFTCGDCIRGYVENSDGKCQAAVTPLCPEKLECNRRRRLPCTAETRGKCGACRLPYLDIYDVCITEEVADELVNELRTAYEEMTSENKQDAAQSPAPSTAQSPADAPRKPPPVTVAEQKYSQPSKESSEEKAAVHPRKPGQSPAPVTGSQSDADFYVDKKAEISVDGEVVESASSSSPELQLAVETSDSYRETTGLPVEDNSKSKSGTSGEKRVPAADSSNMSPYQYAAHAGAAAAAASSRSDANSEHLSGDVAVNQLVFFIVVLSVSLLCLTSLLVATVCWYRLYKQRKSMETVDYAGYGDYQSSTGGPGESGDRKLAQSAQMYHYQHHKQQMMAQEKSMSDKMGEEESDADDEPEEDADGQYTVYMCPGLAPLGEMEIENPVFQGNKQTSSPTSPHSDRSSAGSKNSS